MIPDARHRAIAGLSMGGMEAALDRAEPPRGLLDRRDVERRGRRRPGEHPDPARWPPRRREGVVPRMFSWRSAPRTTSWVAATCWGLPHVARRPLRLSGDTRNARLARVAGTASWTSCPSSRRSPRRGVRPVEPGGVNHVDSSAGPAVRGAGQGPRGPEIAGGCDGDVARPCGLPVRRLRSRPRAATRLAEVGLPAIPAPEVFGTDVIGVPKGSDLVLDLSLESISEGIWVSGTIAARAVGECSRCLGEVAEDDRRPGPGAVRPSRRGERGGGRRH